MKGEFVPEARLGDLLVPSIGETWSLNPAGGLSGPAFITSPRGIVPALVGRDGGPALCAGWTADMV